MRIILTFVLVCIFSISYISLAHVTTSDGSIRVTMHVSPDDDPVARQNSDIFFIISDDESKFSLYECECLVTISVKNKVYLSELLTSSSASITFPSKGIYKIELAGKPKNKSFSDFYVTFDLRIDKEIPIKILPFLRSYYIPILLLMVILILSYLLMWTKSDDKIRQ